MQSTEPVREPPFKGEFENDYEFEEIPLEIFPAMKKLNIYCGSFYIPKRNPLRPRGEDAHFICQKENAFGVADGVGGWAEEGVDAGEYARTLMANCAAAVGDEAAKGAVDPEKVLTKGYLKTKVIGSSTACVVALRGNMLHVANVGDSGFMIFREKKLVYVSKTQQHYFNCPYQLQTGSRDGLPVRAWMDKVKVVAGDIVVIATDGLLDNVHASEIEKVLTKETVERVKPENLARRLARLALQHSMDTRLTTPFAAAATKSGYLHEGGKIDDITVVVGYVVAQSP